MLDVSTNNGALGNFASSVAGSIDDDMDPLFDNDWLHESNLDLLFDLFEEEVERKGMDGSSYHNSNNNFYQQPQSTTATTATTNSSSSSSASTSSSTIFGTSPITSYLFGNSASLASALDLYDFLYSDNQHPSPASIINSSSSQSSNPTNNTNNINKSNLKVDHSSFDFVDRASAQKTTDSQQNCRHGTSSSHIANSITNAMRIKRKLKKGKSEGISLLAKPLGVNNNGSGCNTNHSNGSSSTGTTSNINKNDNGKITSGTHNTADKNYSDKSSSKQLASMKKLSITGNNSNNRHSSGTGSIDIKHSRHQQQSQLNRSNKHLHHYYQHVHLITGCAVIREHAYAAVRSQ